MSNIPDSPNGKSPLNLGNLFNQNNKQGLPLGLIIGTILFFLFLWASQPDRWQPFRRPIPNITDIQNRPSQNSLFPPEEICSVDRCVDGDTIIVISQGEPQRVRFIGVDTPETVKANTPVQPFGPEASDFTKKAIEEAGNFVTLRTDGDFTDRYGRRLAMVYLGKEGERLLNEELIRAGLGRAELKYRYSKEMKKRFAQAQKEAQNEKKGIWSLPENGN